MGLWYLFVEKYNEDYRAAVEVQRSGDIFGLVGSAHTPLNLCSIRAAHKKRALEKHAVRRGPSCSSRLDAVC